MEYKMRLDPKYLHTVGNKLTWDDKEASKKLYQKYSLELVTVMYENKGMGLAANQCGVNIQMFIMKRANGTILTCINPELIHTDGPWEQPNMVTDTEGCLSFEGEQLEIERPNNCSVRYQDYAGTWFTADFEGLEARCWLHEYDHCQGITMDQRFNNEVQYS
jgi:peptide deformylase